MKGQGAEPGRGPVAIVVAMLPPLLAAAMLLVLLQRPIWDPDIFWQLKIGEMILARGSLIQSEPFAVTHLGEPFPAFAWLGQILMAKVRLLWGWTGLQVFDALCWLGGLLIAAAACRRRGSSAVGITIALGVAFWIAFPTASIRPQSFAVLCFGVLLALLRLELKPWRTTWVAVPLFVLWQNLHPSVSVAAVALGAHAAVDWARWLCKRSAPPWEMTLLSLLAAAAMLATPDGWSAIRYSALNAQASAAMKVNEWLPLWDPVNLPAAKSLGILVALIAGGLAFNRRRIDLRELAVAVAFLVMTAFANRFILFFAISLIPLIARAVKPPLAPYRLPTLVTPVLLLVIAVVTPLREPAHFSDHLALPAIHRLRDENLTGTVFTHVPWGGPAIDIGYPRWRVAYDGRFYRYTPEEWRFYRGISEGKVPLADVERRYHPVAFVLDPGWNPSLIAELRAAPAWREPFSDGIAVVFVRKPHVTAP